MNRQGNKIIVTIRDAVNAVNAVILNHHVDDSINQSHDTSPVVNQPVVPPVNNVPSPNVMEETANLRSDLNNRECMVTGKYFCLPCQCENDLNKCNPYMCKCHDCSICNSCCKCPNNCHNHKCYCGSFYQGDAGWCCPLFLIGIFNDTLVSPLLIHNNVSECDCDMFIIPPLLTFCNTEKVGKHTDISTCSILGFWGKCTEGTVCCWCPTIDKCHNGGFLFFGANKDNCYPFWFNHYFSDTCNVNSKLICFRCEHESKHVHGDTTEKWSKYGCATFIPYCYSHTYDTHQQTDKLCGCFGIIPLSITKKINVK